MLVTVLTCFILFFFFSSYQVITVGSSDSQDSRSSFSCYGRCVQLFAPGSSITSLAHDSNDGTKTYSGTSMACPHVAGEPLNFLVKHVFVYCCQFKTSSVKFLLMRNFNQPTTVQEHDFVLGYCLL